MKPITLPEGHIWKQVGAFTSAETAFQCEKCWATFTHDLVDNSQHFEDGDGSCDEENE